MSSIDLEIDIDCSMNTVAERSASAPSSPNERSSVLRDIASLGGCGSSRRVTFPDDETIVTGYFEAPDPWGEEVSTDNIVAAYRAACWKQGVKPLQRVLQQLQAVTLNADLEFELNLKGENLDAQHCEALEEIFKRLQFRSLLLEDSNLNDEGAAALFDMIEYYDTTSHLSIAANRSIGNQGWQACCKMLKRTPCLQYLDASRTCQNEQSLLILGRAFRTGSYLATLRLEDCAISGRSLVILVAALKLNNTLVELFLGENKICSADGLQLGNLLRSNSTLELLDLSTNNLQDLGVCHLVDGLCQQAASCGECLKTLNLASNGLTRNGMAHVNRALLVSESLSSLDVSGNRICDEGIQQMKQGLLTNQSLEELRLVHAEITCEGAVALAEFIADNQHIGRIDLRENEIRLAGLMALSLSLQHSQSVTSLCVDTPPPTDSRGSDVTSSEQKLVGDIREYCGRNRRRINLEQEVDFVVQNSPNVPVIRSEAELTALIQGKASSHRNGTNPTAGMIPDDPLGASKNRFQVCRVFLETDRHRLEEEEADYNSNDGTPPAGTRKPSSIRHQDSLALHKHKQQSVAGRGEEDDRFCYTRFIQTEDTDAGGRDEIVQPDTIDDCQTDVGSHGSSRQHGLMARRSSGSGKVTKKLKFVLPEDHTEHMGTLKTNRRMSTPAVATQRLVQQRHSVGSMKLGRQLEGLDLRSSVPLSPTRLREGLVFPDPCDLKGGAVIPSS